MVKCDRCGIEAYMPFRCNYCGGYFCEQHRLPEFHECSGTFNAPRSTVQIGSYSTSGGSQGYYSTSRVIHPYWFSKIELRDLAIGLLVIIFAPLIKMWSFAVAEPVLALSILLILSAAFILHELAHKFAAQRLGMWAEFRLNSTGLLLTFLSFFLLQAGVFPLMIVAPGAVMIAGMLNWNDYGKISIAGPATNIAQALIYLSVYFLVPVELVKLVAAYGMAVNSGLSLFNLIPFGVFDGMKIFKWNWKVWLVAALISGLIFLYVWL